MKIGRANFAFIELVLVQHSRSEQYFQRVGTTFIYWQSVMQQMYVFEIQNKDPAQRVIQN